MSCGCDVAGAPSERKSAWLRRASALEIERCRERPSESRKTRSATIITVKRSAIGAAWGFGVISECLSIILPSASHRVNHVRRPLSPPAAASCSSNRTPSRCLLGRRQAPVHPVSREHQDGITLGWPRSGLAAPPATAVASRKECQRRCRTDRRRHRPTGSVSIPQAQARPDGRRWR